MRSRSGGWGRGGHLGVLSWNRAFERAQEVTARAAALAIVAATEAGLSKVMTRAAFIGLARRLGAIHATPQPLADSRETCFWPSFRGLNREPSFRYLSLTDRPQWTVEAR